MFNALVCTAVWNAQLRVRGARSGQVVTNSFGLRAARESFGGSTVLVQLRGGPALHLRSRRPRRALGAAHRAGPRDDHRPRCCKSTALLLHTLLVLLQICTIYSINTL